MRPRHNMQDMLSRISTLDATREGRSKNLLLGSIAALFGLFLLGVNNVLGPSASAILVALLGVALAVQVPPAGQPSGPVADQDPETAAGLAFLKRSGGAAAHHQFGTAYHMTAQPRLDPLSTRARSFHCVPQQQIVRQMTPQNSQAARNMALRLQSLEQELQKASDAESEQTSRATSALQSKLIQLQRHHEVFAQEARLASDKLQSEHKLELQRLEQAYKQELGEQHQAAVRAQHDGVAVLEDARESVAQLVAQQQQYQAREMEVARLKEQLTQQKETYEEATKQAQVVAKKLEALQRDHDRTGTDKLHQVESALEEAREAAHQAEVDAAKVRKNFQEFRRSHADELEELRSREQRAVKLAETAQREALASSSTNAEWKGQASALRTENSALQTQVQELEEERRNWQQQRRRSRAEIEEASGTMAHLSSQLQRLQQENASLQQHTQAVREQEANVAKQVEQAQLETNRATAHASDLRQQLEICQQELVQIKADQRETSEKAKKASKLAAQLKELQKELDDSNRQRRNLLTDLQKERHDLEKARQTATRAQEAVVQERKRCLLLEADLSRAKDELRSTPHRERPRRQTIGHGYTSPNLDAPSDDAAIETLGAMLQRSVMQAPMETRQNFKRQLLLCFHPDRNPAKEVATRVTQILNCTD